MRNQPGFNQMAAAPDQSGQRKKPERDPNIDENGVPRELWPLRDEMQAWVDRHLDDFGAFLTYRGVPFKIVCGKGFYYEPGTDKVVLSVPYFKEAKEKTGMTIDQIFFASLHEFAHLKTMMELDRAGKQNQLAQFEYEGEKVIRDKADPNRFVSLQPTYRHFYNVLEDAVVNRLVLDTPYFSERATEVSRARNQEVRDLYTGPFFAMYEPVAAGQGSFTKNPKYNKGKRLDKRGAEREPYVIATGEGQGDLRRIGKEDFARGFDWTRTEPQMNRSGQFMTFFIKNQMIGLAPADIQDAERNPQGKFKLHEDAALALNRPLHEVYGTFLERIVAKYQNDPWQMQRYLAFLRQPISVPRYEEKNGEIVRTDEVFCTIVEQNQANATEGTIDIGRAKLNFLMNLEVVCRQLGIARPRAATFLDIFNKFKEIDWKAQRSWSIPLKHTMVERMRMIRKTLEPIFSMLCVLDDSFDVEMPPEQSGEEGPGENGGEGGPEGEPKWKPGDKVRDARNGRKGVITAVTLGPDGKPTSVTVDYVEDEAQVQQMAGASGALIPRETVEIPDPDENLILIVRPGQGGSTTSSKSDPRKKEFDGEEPKDKDKNGEPKEGEGDDKPDDKPSDDKKNKKPSRGKGKADKPKPAKDQDLGKVMSGYEKWLREALNQDGRNENLGKLEAAKQSPEHRERAVERERMEEAIRRLRELRRQAKEPVPEENDLRDRAVVEQYFQLEAKLRPFFEKMAEHWTEVVQNIASKIEVKREKYFRSGKVDVERIQRYLPEIEFGADIDDRMIYEQFVEKIISELRPKLLRVILLVDNSGSMAGEKANAVRATVMLLNASLRSLRVLFRNKMRAVLGEDAQRVDLACDVEVRLFGAQHERIQKFAIKDLKFVRDDNSPFPALDPDQEMLATLRVFQKFAADGSHTDDSDAWDEILLDHRNDKVVQELLAGQNMTEVLFQISDGNMNPAATVQPHIEELREMGVSIAGLAIGGGDAERNLLERLGQGNVALSDRPEQLVERFGELLKRIVGERVAKVMEDILQTEQ